MQMETVRAWRYIAGDDERPDVGDVLPNSYAWDGDEPADIELPGTCAWETYERAEAYAASSRGWGWLVEIEGEFAGYDGQEEGAILVRDAVVVGVQDW